MARPAVSQSRHCGKNRLRVGYGDRSVDVCVVTYRHTADRVRLGLRSHDRLWVRDNTHDNIGFGAACNELAAKGDQDVIVFVNPDGDPQAGCFDALEGCVREPGVVAAEANLGPWWDALWEPRDEYRNSWLSGACLAVRRDVFEKVGGFDASLFLYYEDVDLSWKLAEHGRLAVCRQAVFLHDPKPDGNSLKAEFYLGRNKIRVFRRWGHPWGVADGLKNAAWLATRGHPIRAAVQAAASVAASGNR